MSVIWRGMHYPGSQTPDGLRRRGSVRSPIQRRTRSARICACYWSLVIGCAGLLPAKAVVDANSATNTSPPPDGAPWANVGLLNWSSGIYVGGGWVLTAAHVGPGDIDLNGVVFQYDGTFQRLTNSDATLTDMVMFRLATTPNLPRLTLASRRPSAGSEVEFVGGGRIAGSGQTELGLYTGFYWSGGQYKSWGNNRVNAGGLGTINIGYGKVTAFSTDFTAPGLTQSPHEAQAAQGDSGGAAFQLSGQDWQLTGMMSAIATLPDQPAGSAAYGNYTYVADIATYWSQIASIMTSGVPRLAISRSGANVVVFWPDTGASYRLQTTPSLSNPLWAQITPSLTLSNGQYYAVLPADGPSRFYRLSN